LAGANQIYGAGMIESGVTFDCAQLVMDDEIAAMIAHVVRGFRVDDEALAVEDIAAVGPFGDFLSLDATMRHMREQSQPKYLDRRVREDWQEHGGTDLYQRAQTAALEIIESHKPLPLDPDAAKRIRAIVEAADRERGVVSPPVQYV
jgi:trimethylamine---corrinoid protein Co-methyltransferase